MAGNRESTLPNSVPSLAERETGTLKALKLDSIFYNNGGLATSLQLSAIEPSFRLKAK